MDITFLGAAREVTGSCHIVTVNGRSIALDFGMFQGRRRDTRDKNAELPPELESVDSLVLSHAHMDHAGRLPLLAKHGIDMPIYATPATRDLSAIMLADSAHIQERDAEHLAKRNKTFEPPLYDMRNAADVLDRFVSISYGRTFHPAPGIVATFVDAGHILGSASVVLDCDDGGVSKRLVFSADIGRAGLPIIRDPQPPEGADAVIMESTYGNRDHVSVAEMPGQLAAIIRETAQRGGKVMIPAFAMGRTQELIYDLHRLARAREIPEIPIFVDSPLAIEATSIFAMHPEIFDETEQMVAAVRDLFKFNLVTYTREATDSKALNARSGPMIIIAASGMAESGRILHHLLHGAADPRNTILIVGFQAEHTLGRRIVERRPELRILGEDVPLRARVEILNGYSAHADRTELTSWLHAVRRRSPKPPKVWLVHGEPVAQDTLAGRLRGDGYDVGIPERKQRVTF
jgi:metallo-beta-lactamase family protein